MLKSRIKIILAEKDLMAKDLAEQMNVTKFVVSNWLNNKSRPSAYKCYDVHVQTYSLKDVHFWLLF
ncbi:helix-turn-helix domain-containing protein [Kurthia zopfii]|uniref:helix-turn-helix domain-containing protein n=1 Tax=Kurthia zopfii TaxID=1650 RepID=UPI000F6F6C50|nr:helix-turn-helix transcriptional regulator [Kurthia zopfii]VEI08131.1 Uncharacterised protein [Kurthia zopfii]